jgi:hypothetical protein
VTKAIDDNIVFADISKSEEALWSFLLMNGYLRYDNLTENEENFSIMADLSIPNREIMALFVKDIVTKWFERPTSTAELEHIANLLTSGDLESFKNEFKKFCENSFSYYDVSGHEPEKFYHGFVLGMLTCLRDKYKIKSNRESGHGRYDVVMIPRAVDSRGIIFEFKTLDKSKNETVEKAITKAKKQIANNKYEQELRDEGVNEIAIIIAVFEGKEATIVAEIVPDFHCSGELRSPL